MKTLLILRHAKSSWKLPDLSDHDRPLNRRGKRDAPRMGKLLKEKELAPDLVISSTATRAKDTASAVANHSGYKGKKIKFKSLYAAEPSAYLAVLRELDDKYQRVLIVGHNPGVEELIEMLTGEIHIIPTCTLAQIEFDTEKWSAILRGLTDRGRLIEILRPGESNLEI
jgi:phosphohistidine phosphatase